MEISVENRELIRDHITVAWGPAITVINDQWWLNCKIDGEGPFLYDLAKDPLLKENIAKENKDIVNRLFAKAITNAGGSFPNYLLELAKRRVDFPGCSPIAARL